MCDCLVAVSVAVSALRRFYSLKGSPTGRGGSISLPPPNSILYAKESDPVIREGSHP